MTQIAGIRNGHRVITTVTGPPGAISVDRQHHPDCPCHAQPGRRLVAGSPDYILQRWNWDTEEWETHRTFPDNERAAGNAWFAVRIQQAGGACGPIRLLHGEQILHADNPDTHYTADAMDGW